MTELGANWLPKDLYRDNKLRKKFIITDLVISATQWNHNTVISTLVSRVWQIEKIKKFCLTEARVDDRLEGIQD